MPRWRANVFTHRRNTYSFTCIYVYFEIYHEASTTRRAVKQKAHSRTWSRKIYAAVKEIAARTRTAWRCLCCSLWCVDIDCPQTLSRLQARLTATVKVSVAIDFLLRWMSPPGSGDIGHELNLVRLSVSLPRNAVPAGHHVDSSRRR